MFQRLKGAIDNRIAEEQARQRQSQQNTPRSGAPARRRAPPHNGAPARSSAAAQEALAAGKGPDPKQFEDAFDTDDSESVTVAVDVGGSGAPTGPAEGFATGQGEIANRRSEDVLTKKSEGEDAGERDGLVSSDKGTDLSVEVRTRLRRLDRLESKYGELLKAYRVANAQIQAIEPFEASLRENTPLTGISDPTSLVEYLNQIKLKGDMVLEELKRVTSEREEYKKKAEQLGQDKLAMKAEVDRFGSQASSHSEEDRRVKDIEARTKKGSQSGNSRVGSFSMFSPRSAQGQEEAEEASEDFFSYDTEVPRLEAELQEKTAEAAQLTHQVADLKKEVEVARESMDGLKRTMEAKSEELSSVQEAGNKIRKANSELEQQIAAVRAEKVFDQTQLVELRTAKQAAESHVVKLEESFQLLEKTATETQAQLEAQKASAEQLTAKLAQKDHLLEDLENSLAMAKKGEREFEAREEHLKNMEELLEGVRQQLTTAEGTARDLKAELDANKEVFAGKPSTKVFSFLDPTDLPATDGVESREDAVRYLTRVFGLSVGNQMSDDATAEQKPNGSVHTRDASVSGSGGKKKSNKKKKKGGKGQSDSAVDAEPLGPVKVSEDLSQVQDTAANSQGSSTSQEQSTRLEEELQEKKATIARLEAKLQDQDALKEEIETLRDDLLHQGEEHVEARDALKTMREERKSLEDRVEQIKSELMESKKLATRSSETEAEHQDLQAQFSELRQKYVGLERDLKAAESLAAARFKDISDLKDLLSKAQPELRSLRAEAAELRTVQESLKNKQGELRRLEGRHDDLKSEIKSLGKRLSEKDAGAKDLQQKIEQESKARARTEEELTLAQSELRVAQKLRKEGAERSEKLSTDLAQTKEEATALRNKVHRIEEQLSTHTTETRQLREELSLKTALHTSSQHLVQSLRDQMHELGTQSREAASRTESLEEELAEMQRMLSERTREASTMRFQLDKSNIGTESRLRDLRERMDAAIEERNRVEDEASVNNRRSMREVEEAKTRAREAQRQLKVLEHEKEDADHRAREWRRRQSELEQIAETATREVEDAKSAMKGLREALDESDRQIREAESQKLELRKAAEDALERLEKLTRANKTLTEDIKILQQQQHLSTTGLRKGGVRPAGTPTLDSDHQSTRTSSESITRSPAPLVARAASPRSETPVLRISTSGNRGADVGLSQAAIDYVYLKNVLLQFLEQKDKSHQRALVPVLAMLLHFDR